MNGLRHHVPKYTEQLAGISRLIHDPQGVDVDETEYRAFVVKSLETFVQEIDHVCLG